MKCSNCGGPETLGTIIVSIDGDWVCGNRCKAAYEGKRDHFLGDVIQDDRKMAEWWKGNDFVM